MALEVQKIKNDIKDIKLEKIYKYDYKNTYDYLPYYKDYLYIEDKKYA